MVDDGGPGFGGITITRKVSPTGEVLREARVVSGSKALRRRVATIERERREREGETERIVLTEGEKEFRGTLDPRTGEILAVRTLTPIEQRRIASQRAGFVSIDPRLQPVEPGIQPVERVAQQLALRIAIPITTRGIPLEQRVELRRREVAPTPEPTTLQKVVGAVVRPIPLPRAVERGIRQRFETLSVIQRQEVEEFRTVVQESRLPQPVKRTLLGFGTLGEKISEISVDVPETFLTDIRRPIIPLTVGVLGVAGRVISKIPAVGPIITKTGEALLLGGFIGEETAQVILGRKRVGEALGTFAAVGVAAKGTEALFELPGRVRGKVREIKLQRGVAALERGAMLEEPFRVLRTETLREGQLDLFGRPVPEVKVRRAIRELDINKVAFGIERNPLRPVPEGILPTGQQRLAEDVLLGVSRITGEARPVRVVDRQPFIFEPRVGRFVEFVPQGEFGLVTVSPQVQARTRVDIFDTSIQTQLVKPEPPSRIFRRLPPPERLPPPKVTQPRRFGRGVDTVSIRTTTAQDLLFTGRQVQETFLIAPEPLPVIPRVRRLSLLLSPLRISDVAARRERVSTLDALSLSLIPGEAFRLDVRPEQRVDIFQELVPRTLPREALDIGLIQVQDVGQITIPDIPTAPLPPPLLPDFDITRPPRQAPIPPTISPLLLGLPRGKQRGRRREALLEPFKQPKEFVPSVAAFTFRVFGEPKEEQLFGGFEFRPIPKRLRGLL